MLFNRAHNNTCQKLRINIKKMDVVVLMGVLRGAENMGQLVALLNKYHRTPTHQMVQGSVSRLQEYNLITPKPFKVTTNGHLYLISLEKRLRIDRFDR